MKPIIVWDSVTQFARLPGGWLLPLGLAVLFLSGIFLMSREFVDGVVLFWRERQERKADRINAALRRAQAANERSLRLVGGNWRRG